MSIKQVVIAGLEELFGEYILNMSRENLKIAALRGKIKLENVQLDGDMLGSHVLNALGLQSTSFGILSCSVETINIIIPWNSLEKDATKLQMEGVHMVCVPLVPSTAHQMYGAGTKHDPQCTLRTRLKRLLLSRLERNFWNGQYSENGGPPLKRIQRAVDDIRKTVQQQKKKQQQQDQQQGQSTQASDGDNVLGDGDEISGEEWLFQTGDEALPELPKDWKKKLQEKMMRNMEASMCNVHIRVEVPRMGLDFESLPAPTSSGPANNINSSPRRRKHKIVNTNTIGGEDNEQRESSPFFHDLFIEQRAFCLGFTMGRLVVRTANEEWKVGSHDTRNPINGSQMSSVKGHLGPNEYVVKNNKIGFFTDLSLYWDQDPPFLLAETDLLRGCQYQKQRLTADKWQSRISQAMHSLFYQQEPGTAIRQSLGARPPSALLDGVGDGDRNFPHVYVCHDLQAEIRVRISDRTLPGPISCSADVVPLQWDFSLRPHQYKQYNLLRAAITRQQRFDTMLRQRPNETPLENPRAWWAYAIACVTARPNSRPWKDVRLICRKRSRYMELVMIKNKHRIADNSVNSTGTNNGGYHAGLSDAESAELLSLEELLPLEALQAFHLLALRQCYQLRVQQQEQQQQPKEKPQDKQKRGFFRFRKKHRRQTSRGSVSEFTLSSVDDESGGGVVTINNSSGSEDEGQQNRGEITTESRKNQDTDSKFPQQVTLMEAMTVRLGNKPWFIDWRFHNVNLNVGMVVDDMHLASLQMNMRGNVRTFGKGKRDVCFDMTQCDLVHGNKRILYIKAEDDDVLTEFDEHFSRGPYYRRHSGLSSASPSFQNDLTNSDTVSLVVPTIESLLRETASQSNIKGEPNLALASSFLELPPSGVVCRIVSGTRGPSMQKISISSHPATFLWTHSFVDGIQQFQKTNPDIGQHMRNVATPLARKAQLALASPGTRAVHLNVRAPKIWIPIVSNYEPGGTLILDAGAARLQGEKREGELDMTVHFRVTDFQANFVRNHHRGMSTTGSSAGGEFSFGLGQSTPLLDTAVIRPFNISVDAQTFTELDGHDYNLTDADPDFLQTGILRKTEVHVSPICLNLVDAEVLARALGRWYARSVSRVSRHKERRKSDKLERPESSSGQKESSTLLPVVDRTGHLFVTVEKVEIALEGHSKRRSEDCDRSMASLDSLHDSSPPIRAYLMEIDAIEMNRTSRGPMAAARLVAQDASIVRLRDGASYAPLRKRREIVDSQYCILVRSNRETTSKQPVLRASLLHDGRNHLDEVEVDIDSVVLRVTTTTLKDCVKATRRVAEVAQLTTTAMERKVHEEGRKARKRSPLLGGRDGNVGSFLSYDLPASMLGDRPPSPAFSLLTDVTGAEKMSMPSPQAPSDSSILFRVTLNESTLLAGRPIGAIFDAPIQGNNRSTSFAVIQILSSALIMFQSIENPDGTGSKTAHVSIDNASSLVNTEFERVSPSLVPPMIGPTGAEFRVVYATENLGCVVSQDVALDCEGVKICLTPNDFTIMRNISLAMVERLREISGPEKLDSPTSPGGKGRGISSLVRYKKKGAGIATNIRIDVLSVNFVLLKAYKSYLGSPEFMDFCLSELKGRLDGCMTALSGETSAQLSIMFYDSDTSEWEYAMEPVQLLLDVDQMPNEITLRLSGKSIIQLNLTGVLLRDLADMKFDFRQDRRSGKAIDAVLSESVISTVGLRRATEAPSLKVRNLTGFDVHVIPDSTPFAPESGRIPDGETCTIESLGSTPLSLSESELTFSMRVASSAQRLIGERESVFDLPVRASVNQKARLHLLRPVSYSQTGRASPETVLTEESPSSNSSKFMAESAEPVVEYCMHNQRLSSSVSDVYSIPKGYDLLSGSVWSPADQDNFETNDPRVDRSGPESPGPISPSKHKSPRRSGSALKSYWVKPYQSDSPEWTDMTCSLRMALERIMLPDSNWMWANDWTVSLGGKLGESTDADGWEYQTDFESFTRRRRDYQRGDTCRRRCWTRTRMVAPPRLDDPNRLLRFVWDPSTDSHGNVCVQIRSHLRITNATAGSLSFFLYAPGWPSLVPVGTAGPGKHINVPVTLANAVYLTIGRGGDEKSIPDGDSGSSERIMIIPTSPTSSNYVRTSMDLGDVLGTVLHFLVEIRSERGIVDVVIEPVLRIINLLPCQVECQIGEMLQKHDPRKPDIKPVIGKRGRPITMTETMTLDCGKETTFTAVNPWRKPHVSFRVPGYRWSLWQRIINRKRGTETWRPSEDEEDWHYTPKSDADFADEYKTTVHFERWTKSGDPLLLIMSVEFGHCPTVRLYSQYWILDKSGFGCHFAEGFEDILGTVPDKETSRRSFLPASDTRDSMIRKDMSLQGYQWSIGANGMSLFFSRREKLTFAIEYDTRAYATPRSPSSAKSRWINLLDISNVMPKTVVSVDELRGTRCYEFAVSVNVCPGIFSRTRLITVVPRYQIVNLLHRELVVAQDGCLDASTVIPSQTSVPFHWEIGGLPPTVRLSTFFQGDPENQDRERKWTNGRVRLDRVGITSMRIPMDNNLTKIPFVVQTEVRLATKEQPAAVIIVIWSANEKMHNPLYSLRNTTPYTILCRQPLQDQDDQTDYGRNANTAGAPLIPGPCSHHGNNDFHCGQTDVGPMILSFLGLDQIEEFVWIIQSGDFVCFGFDDPEKPHILEWTCVSGDSPRFDEQCHKAFLEVDAMGSTSTLLIAGGKQIKCRIGAEHSTKVIEFTELVAALNPGRQIVTSLKTRGLQYHDMIKSEGLTLAEAEEEEDVGFGVRLDFPGFQVSVVDNCKTSHGREILLADFDRLTVNFCQNRDGYHEFEFQLMSFQLDNHVQNSIHPVLIFCAPLQENEPLLHMSAVRRLQHHSSTYVFRYAAIRLLEVEIFLDRRTAETIANFIEPLTAPRETQDEDPSVWARKITKDMESGSYGPQRPVPGEVENTLHSANSGRIYFEQLHLHPVRLSLTFTQEWIEWDTGAESVMLFQFIRGMASIANAPLTFTSFVVSHVFEAPHALGRVILTHYASQLTKQIFAILGSLAIFTAPADFISNVGTGVRDFFYEPINGAVHGPRQFIEGLEAGTQSLARGVFVGFVRGAANVTELVNANLVGLTADDEFIDERKAHQRLLTDALSRGTTTRSFGDSLYLAGASVARSFRSGALGIVEQPAMYASKHGPVGFLKGVGKALVGAVVKPVVGVGDAAVLVMNHMSDVTSTKPILPKIPKRLRRALPSQISYKPNVVRLVPYDERAAKAQKIVTGGESLDDVYYGHLQIPSHLIIASHQCLWAIDRRSREPWCANWEEVSHFSRVEGGVRVVVFSKTGLKSYTFHVETKEDTSKLYDLLSMHSEKMGNSSELNNSLLSTKSESLSRHQIPGVKGRQVNHIFGSCNGERHVPESAIKDEIDLVEQSFARVKRMGSESTTFFKNLDEEAWSLITSWGILYPSLSSKRCLVAGLINGTNNPIQIKSTKLMEGGSPCYTIPTKEFDPVQGVLHAGGCILFFGWGLSPNLVQDGNVFMSLETNAFISNLATFKSPDTFAEAMPGYQVGFLEKSVDDAGWWAKYWLLVRRES